MMVGVLYAADIAARSEPADIYGLQGREDGCLQHHSAKRIIYLYFISMYAAAGLYTQGIGSRVGIQCKCIGCIRGYTRGLSRPIREDYIIYPGCIGRQSRIAKAASVEDHPQRIGSSCMEITDTVRHLK